MSCTIPGSPEVCACIDPGTYEQGWKRYMAAEIKKHVNIPIIAVCNIKEPDVAEEILVEGCCDFIGVARGHLADPEWCNKAHAGKAQTIRKCIGCLSCFQEIESQRHVKCAVNPKLGREREFENPKHNGQGLVDGLIAQVSASDIELRMGEEATIDKVKALSPCGIFVACGAMTSMPPIPGIDGKNVVTAEDVLIGKAQLKGDCIILGSGMTGLETAEVVLKAGHRTTIVDMLHEIGQGVPIMVLIDIKLRLSEYGPAYMLGHKALEIAEDGVVLERLADGEKVFVNAEMIILALGVQPRKEVVKAFKDAFSQVHIIGDANRGGRILEATQEAYGSAFVFES